MVVGSVFFYSITSGVSSIFASGLIIALGAWDSRFLFKALLSFFWVSSEFVPNTIWNSIDSLS